MCLVFAGGAVVMTVSSAAVDVGSLSCVKVVVGVVGVALTWSAVVCGAVAVAFVGVVVAALSCALAVVVVVVVVARVLVVVVVVVVVLGVSVVTLL